MMGQQEHCPLSDRATGGEPACIGRGASRDIAPGRRRFDASAGGQLPLAWSHEGDKFRWSTTGDSREQGSSPSRLAAGVGGTAGAESSRIGAGTTRAMTSRGRPYRPMPPGEGTRSTPLPGRQVRTADPRTRRITRSTNTARTTTRMRQQPRLILALESTRGDPDSAAEPTACQAGRRARKPSVPSGLLSCCVPSAWPPGNDAISACVDEVDPGLRHQAPGTDRTGREARSSRKSVRLRLFRTSNEFYALVQMAGGRPASRPPPPVNERRRR
ncbi:hypothetical protein SCHAM137S_02077 [Streptomyces chartreusis]